MNNLTNQPVRFQYEAFVFEGQHVGIISIDKQTRPIYLKRDYGKLTKERVYVRRGSSTDPTKPASPEEVAQMRIGSGQSIAELVVEFSDAERDRALGVEICWNAEFSEMPAMEAIPDLAPQRRQNPFAFDPMERLNADFLRERAEFEFVHRLFHPIRLVVKDVGQVAANNVRAELVVPVSSDVMVMTASQLPDSPKRRTGLMRDSVLKGIRPAVRRDPCEVTVDANQDRTRVDIDCGDLQPGRRVWSDVFYVAKEASGDACLRGMLYADNLPRPNEFVLAASVNVTRTSMTVDELRSLS